MEKKMESYDVMSKVKFEVESKLSELEKAKDQYRDDLMNETITNILNVFNEEGKITERDLKIFLDSLLHSVKNIYSY